MAAAMTYRAVGAPSGNSGRVWVGGIRSLLTATLASQFIKTDTESDEVMETLRRIEADVAELKARIPAS